MAASSGEEGTKKTADNKEGKKPFVHRTAMEAQRYQLLKLMADPDKDIVIPEGRKQWQPNAPPEFIRHVMGSSAGAGSGEFHVYRATRRKEYARTAWIEQQAKEKEEQESYHQKIEKLKSDADAKTAKKRGKRQKRKQRKVEAKRKKNADSAGDEDNGEKHLNQSDESEDDEPHFVIGGK